MTLKISHSQTSHRGNHREQNEDSCENKETRNGHLFVTCDGMGGAAEGKKASSIGVKSIVEFFERETYENLQIALYQSLKFANEQIYATAQLNSAFKGMGTTACVVLFNKDEMYFAHVGDSRIYLQTDGKLKHLTRDHSFVNQLVDQGTLKPNEAKNHPEKNRILKALGVHLDLEPTVSSQPALLKKEDIVLLCSDGLTDMVTDPSLEAVLNNEKAITEKTDILLQKALDNGGGDNITVQLIEITESPHTKTVFIDKTPKNLAATLTGEEGAVNGKKYKFSKKHVLIAIPILLLLGWFLVSVLARKDEPKNEVNSQEKKENNQKTTDSMEKEDNTVSIDSDSINDTIKRRGEQPDSDTDKILKENIVMPKYVKINYSNPNPENDIFQIVADILKKYPAITEKSILVINKKEKSTGFKAGDKVYLTQDEYDKAHPKHKEDDPSKEPENPTEKPVTMITNETSKKDVEVSKWANLPEIVTIDDKIDPDKGTVILYSQIHIVTGIKDSDLMKYNKVKTQTEFMKLKKIYTSPKAYEKHQK